MTVRCDGRLVSQPADVAEMLALDLRREHEAVDHLAHRSGVGTGAEHQAALGKAFDDPQVLEEALQATTPP